MCPDLDLAIRYLTVRFFDFIFFEQKLEDTETYTKAADIVNSTVYTWCTELSY